MFSELYNSENIKKSWQKMFKEFTVLCNNDEEYKKCYDNIEKIIDSQNNDKVNIYPEKSKILKAFEYFDVNECKVVILGQDPYHQKDQATGLAFSVNNNIKIPPSLINIFREIINDKKCARKVFPISGDLTEWAKQGVLLLNTSLTVEESKPNIHSKDWLLFTDFVINWISKNVNNKLVFMLWGSNAKKKKKLIENKNKHLILEANHPSPLSANRGGWFNCGHFGETSDIINW